MTGFNNFEHSQVGIDSSDLDKLETMLTHKLPADFRAQYLLFNGGEPEKCLYLFNGDPLVVQEFFSIARGSGERTIEGNYKELVEIEKIIPNNFLPFGRDPGGDFYCLDMLDGSVSIFRAEYLPNISDCITVISGSMGEFLDGLTEDV